MADGRSYEEIVTEELFSPLGITSARVEPMAGSANNGYYMATRDTVANMANPANMANKANHVGESDVTPVWCLAKNGVPSPSLVRRMDAHGGWSMSAVDVLRFSEAIETDGLLLSTQSREAMVTTHPASRNYGMGWFTNTHARWHDGRLSGTAAIVVHTSRQGGMGWAMLVNTGRDALALDNFAWRCVDAVKAMLVGKAARGNQKGWL